MFVRNVIIIIVTDSMFFFICRLATKVEEQYEDFLGLVPDPFDDRHPCTYDTS